MTTIAVVYALVAYALHITIGGRLAGWAGEPGDISLLILPTLVYYFYHKEISIRSGITAIAFILATSTASFTSLFIVLSIFLFIYNRKNFIKLISASLIVFVVGSIISNFFLKTNLTIMKQLLNLKKHGICYKTSMPISQY